jgi:hypothetical protein
MNAFTNLPLPVRIAIPAVLVLLLGLILWMTAFKQPQPVEVIKTKDYDVYATAKLVLENAHMAPTESAANGDFILSVPPGDDAKTAATALAAAGIQDRTGMAKTIKCPSAPGFTATKAATEEYTNCSQAKEVQTMLMAAGATAANVKVSQEDNGTLLGPEKSMNVVAQVFLPSSMDDKWDAEQAARTISRAVGTTLDRVTITDSRLQTMFDGTASSAAKGAGTASAAAALSSLGCSDIAGATEVETKKAAVRSCYEQTIGAKLTELLGGSDRYVLSVDPTIGSVASQTTTTRNTQGPATSRSTQSGGGQKTEDVATPANTVERTSIAPAGGITSLRISVILDKDSVTEDQKLAVQRLLSTQVNAKRGDPAPVVTMSQFAGGAGDKPSNDDFEAIKAQAQSADDAVPQPMKFETRTQTPGWMFAVIGLLVVGTAVAIALLLRRSKAMDAERSRMEQAFSHEQKLFENFAQQNPDDLASDLNALFGAPSAPEPRY